MPARGASAGTAAAVVARGDGDVDVETQCAVPMPPDGVPCRKNLACGSHSFSEKRAVRGRSQPFDALLRGFVLAKARGGGAAGGDVSDGRGGSAGEEKKRVDLMDIDDRSGLDGWEVLKPR